MLWLCIHLPALSWEALAAPPESIAGVVETRGRQRRLIGISRAGRARGLHDGMAVPVALGLVPEIRLLPRNPQAETQALQAVACWAYRFGTPVTWSAGSASIWVEIRRSLRLFGGWRSLRGRLEHDTPELHYTHAFGIAPTLAAAGLFARSGAGLARPVHRGEDLPRALRDLPLSLLPFEQTACELLLGSGLRTIGEVLALPRAALSHRCGATTAASLDRLVGRTPEVWQAFEPPARYHRRLELAGAADSTGALLFPLRAMIDHLCWYLRARDVAVQQFRIVFVGARQRVPLAIGLLAPTRDPERLLLVLRERLHNTRLHESVLELALEAERFETAGVVQDDLFQGAQRGQDRANLRERLVARLGAQAVRRIAVSPDHRPEHAWRTQDPAGDTEHPPRPLWLLAQPRAITRPALLGPPERIECGWWAGTHERRDYFVAEDGRGRRLWVYRLGRDRWWLHGLWQ